MDTPARLRDPARWQYAAVMARIVPVPTEIGEIGTVARHARAAGAPRRTASMTARAGSLLAAAATALALGGCAQLLGLEELSPGSDAGPSFFTVRGTASGLLEPVSLRLEYPGGDELLSVTGDGPFAFATQIAAGDAYAVVLVGEPPCVLGNASGNAGATPDVELACGPVLLSSLSLSGPGAPAIDFSPARSAYDLDVSLLQQSVQVTATAASPEASLTVAGAPLLDGASSAPLPLALGDNTIDVVVSHPSGAERTVRLTLRRGATVAQHAYAKASNPGPGDLLGYSLALSGDTLAVGAAYEDSPATGVGGDQGDGAADSGAVYVFRRDGDVWSQEAYLKAQNTGPGDEFGHSVAVDGDVLVVGAPYEDGAARGINGPSDENALDSGAAYVFRRSGAEWKPEAYLKAQNTGAQDNFGWSVGVYGDTVVVGARAEDSSSRGVNGADDDTLSDAGAAYVFRHDGNAWTQEAYLKASNTGLEDNFGRSLVLHGDTLAVGARFEDGASRGVNGDQENGVSTNSGAVYVFRRSGTLWDQEAYLKASNTGVEDNFGLSLALSGDTLAVGAPEEDSGATGANGNQDSESTDASGAVYVFRRTGATWAQEAYLKASNTGAGDNFGWSLSLAGDLLAVGAIGEDSAAKGPGSDQGDNTADDAGAAYVFHRAGAAWTQQAYLKASNTGAGDWFGYTVALSEDTLVVAARDEDSAATGVGGNQDDELTSDSGALYVLH
jgi:hypothetical protein